MEDFFVTVDDLHACPYGGGYGYCHKGTREFFKKYNLDWQEFCFGKGVPASVLFKINDQLGVELAKFAWNQRKKKLRTE